MALKLWAGAGGRKRLPASLAAMPIGQNPSPGWSKIPDDNPAKKQGLPEVLAGDMEAEAHEGESPDELEEASRDEPPFAHQLVVSGRRDRKSALHFVLQALL